MRSMRNMKCMQRLPEVAKRPWTGSPKTQSMLWHHSTAPNPKSISCSSSRKSSSPVRAVSMKRSSPVRLLTRSPSRTQFERHDIQLQDHQEGTTGADEPYHHILTNGMSEDRLCDPNIRDIPVERLPDADFTTMRSYRKNSR